MNDPTSFDRVLRQAVAGLSNDDVQLFYAYFQDLKDHVRRCLGHKAKAMPGESAGAMIESCG
jgi:hypothetical protein